MNWKTIQFAKGGIKEAIYNGGPWGRKNETNSKYTNK